VPIYLEKKGFTYASSAFLTEEQRQRLFQNKIDRAAAMIRAQEQFRKMQQEQ